MHDVSDADEYRPAGQAVQSLASSEPDTDTLLPAPQVVHVDTFDAKLYFPAPHAVQLIAAELLPVLVMLPAAHVRQLVCALCGWYLPGAQAVALAAPVSVVECGCGEKQCILVFRMWCSQ